MVKKEFKVLGHKVEYSVTESSQEFNKLDTARTDAANDEAVANIVYRSMNPETRSVFLHGRDAEEAKDGKPAVAGVQGVEQQFEAMFDGVQYEPDDVAKGFTISRKTEVAKNAKGETRMRDGVEVEKFIESEEAYYNRALAMSVKYKKFASEDAAREHFQPLIVGIAGAILFDPSAPPPSEKGPKKLAAKYKLAAAKSISLGTFDKVNANLLSKIGKTFVPTNDTSKLYTGKYPTKIDGKDTEVDFSVSDKDAEALGWLIKEYQDWKSNQELAALATLTE